MLNDGDLNLDYVYYSESFITQIVGPLWSAHSVVADKEAANSDQVPYCDGDKLADVLTNATIRRMKG